MTLRREVTARTWKPIVNGEHKNCLDKICEECFERRLNETHIAGQAAAYESVHISLLNKAGELFKCGQSDTEADLVRSLANEYKTTGETLRAKQKRIRDGTET